MEHTFEFDLRIGEQKILLRMDRQQGTFRGSWDGMIHNHAAYELHILLSGEATVDVEGASHVLKAGQAMLIPPGQYHCPVSARGVFERFAATFSAGEFEALRCAVGKCRVYAVTEQVLQLCRDIIFECGADAAFSRDVLRGLLTCLMAQQFRALGLRSEAGRNQEKPITRGQHNDIIDTYFETHLKGDARADELAQLLFVSRRQLSRVLWESYGTNFREKLIRTRLDWAAWLLRNTDKSVSSVAEEAGYTVPSSFYHVFRDRFGMTPEQYRVQYAKKQED